MREVGVHEIRANLAEVINRVAYGGERIILERRSKPVLGLVSMEDLELLNALEDRADVKAALKARKEKGAVPLEKIKARLGDGIGHAQVQGPVQAVGGSGTAKAAPWTCNGGSSAKWPCWPMIPARRAWSSWPGHENLWRIRIGNYRVVYEIHDDRLMVLVLRVAHRKDVYRGE